MYILCSCCCPPRALLEKDVRVRCSSHTVGGMMMAPTTTTTTTRIDHPPTHFRAQDYLEKAWYAEGDGLSEACVQIAQSILKQAIDRRRTARLSLWSLVRATTNNTNSAGAGGGPAEGASAANEEPRLPTEDGDQANSVVFFNNAQEVNQVNVGRAESDSHDDDDDDDDDNDDDATADQLLAQRRAEMWEFIGFAPPQMTTILQRHALPLGARTTDKHVGTADHNGTPGRRSGNGGNGGGGGVGTGDDGRVSWRGGGDEIRPRTAEPASASSSSSSLLLSAPPAQYSPRGGRDNNTSQQRPATSGAVAFAVPPGQDVVNGSGGLG